MRKIRSRSRFSKETRELIVLEYLNGEMTQKALCEKYGIHCRTSLTNWVSEYEKKNNLLPLSPEPVKNDTVMATINAEGQSQEELIKLLRQKEAELQRKTMELEALNKLIEIAERNGVSVRKNSGAKR